MSGSESSSRPPRNRIHTAGRSMPSPRPVACEPPRRPNGDSRLKGECTHPVPLLAGDASARKVPRPRDRCPLSERPPRTGGRDVRDRDASHKPWIRHGRSASFPPPSAHRPTVSLSAGGRATLEGGVERIRDIASRPSLRGFGLTEELLLRAVATVLPRAEKTLPNDGARNRPPDRTPPPTCPSPPGAAGRPASWRPPADSPETSPT
jgi:hypothetical protein